MGSTEAAQRRRKDSDRSDHLGIANRDLSEPLRRSHLLRVGQEERSVTRQNLLRLTVIDRSSRKRNTVLGLALGTVAGLAGGGALASAAGWFDEGTGSKPAVAIAGFGAGGAVAGYAIGASSGTRTIYGKRDPNDK